MGQQDIDISIEDVLVLFDLDLLLILEFDKIKCVCTSLPIRNKDNNNNTACSIHLEFPSKLRHLQNPKFGKNHHLSLACAWLESINNHCFLF